MIRRLAKFLGLVLSMVVVGGGLYFYLFLTVSYTTIPKVFRIDKGESASSIIHRLYEENIIPNEELFKIYVAGRGFALKIRAGEYLFPVGVTPKIVAEMLLRGDFRTYRITIIEGWTLKDIAIYLGEMGIVGHGQFLQKCYDVEYIKSLEIESNSLEGYLFPDTYSVYSSEDAGDLIKRFVDRFNEVFGRSLRRRAEKIGMSVHEVVTLASMIEKETSHPDEYDLIGGVFHNRLKKKMLLQSDPTVIYGIPNFDGNLTRKHLETPTPYNTYTRRGLPPGPIASPGEKAIRAVLYPDKTDYLYFVSKNDGSHVFSKNIRDHNRAVWKYQKSLIRSAR